MQEYQEIEFIYSLSEYVCVCVCIYISLMDGFTDTCQSLCSLCIAFFLKFGYAERAVEILVPGSEIKPTSPAVEGQSLIHWTARAISSPAVYGCQTPQ